MKKNIVFIALVLLLTGLKKPDKIPDNCPQRINLTIYSKGKVIKTVVRSSGMQISPSVGDQPYNVDGKNYFGDKVKFDVTY